MEAKLAAAETAQRTAEARLAAAEAEAKLKEVEQVKDYTQDASVLSGHWLAVNSPALRCVRGFNVQSQQSFNEKFNYIENKI